MIKLNNLIWPAGWTVRVSRRGLLRRLVTLETPAGLHDRWDVSVWEVRRVVLDVHRNVWDIAMLHPETAKPYSYGVGR